MRCKSCGEDDLDTLTAENAVLRLLFPGKELSQVTEGRALAHS